MKIKNCNFLRIYPLQLRLPVKSQGDMLGFWTLFFLLLESDLTKLIKMIVHLQF